MLGNVWEWCSNSFAPYPLPVESLDAGRPRVPVLRGGSWKFDTWCVRAARRRDHEQPARNNSFGFRIARDLR
jgi:formylglycine-generating enzyme required for sulfatase activity